MTYLWDFGDTKTSSATNPVKSYSTYGTYTIRLIATSNYGCKDTIEKNVTVHPQSNPDFTINKNNQCISGNDYAYTNTSGIPTGSFKSLWNLGDLTSDTLVNIPSKKYSSAGSYNVKLVLTSNYGCKDSITKTVIVYPKPNVNFNIMLSNQCLRGNYFVFTNTSNISSGTLTYLWDYADGTNSKNTQPAKVYSNAGKYDIKLIATSNFGCKDSLTKTANVNAHPQVVIGLNDPGQCLGGNRFQLEDKSVLTKPDSIFVSRWRFGEGSTATGKNTVFSYTKAGVYKLRLTSTSDKGCQDSTEVSVNVHPQAKLSFYTSDSTQCNQIDTFILNNTSKLNQILKTDSISIYSWFMGDGVVYNQKSVTHSYTKSGFYKVKLISTTNEGCIDSLKGRLTVHPQADINFTINDASQCNGTDTFMMTNLTNIQKIEPSDTVDSYYWYLTDGKESVLKSPEHSCDLPGKYRIRLVTTTNKGCIDTMSKTIAVYAQPKVTFEMNDTGQCNSIDTFIFTNSTQLIQVETGDSVATYLWNYGDGESSALKSNTHSYALDGYYQTKLYAITNQGCLDSISHILEVYPQAVMSFKIDKPMQCLSGNLFSLKDSSTIKKGSISRQWAFGDGNFGNDSLQTHRYSKDGNFDILLTQISNEGCRDSMQQNVTVYPQPLADFTTDDSVQCFQLNNFKFNNKSSISSGNLDYLWMFGDRRTSTLKDPTHQYTIAGVLNVKLIANSGFNCKDSMIKPITIHGNPPMPIISRSGVYLSTDADSGIQWYFNDQPIAGGDKRIQPAAESGQYKLIVHNQYGCPQESEIFDYIFNATETLGFVLFPNPNNGVFKFTSLTPIVRLEIYDAIGKLVFVKSYESGAIMDTIDTELSNAGYMVRAISSSESETVRMMIQR